MERPRRTGKKPGKFYKEPSLSDAEEDTIRRSRTKQRLEKAGGGDNTPPYRLKLGNKHGRDTALHNDGHPDAAQAPAGKDSGDDQTERGEKRQKRMEVAIPDRNQSAIPPAGDVSKKLAGEGVVSSELDAARDYKTLLKNRNAQPVALEGRFHALENEVMITSEMKEKETQGMKEQYEKELAQIKLEYEKQWKAAHETLEARVQKQGLKFQQDMAKVLAVRARYAYKVDDDDASIRLIALCSRVRQLVKKYFYKNLSPEAVTTPEARQAIFSEELRASLNGKMVAAHTMWATQRLRCVIEAWIWSFIYEHVLFCTSTLWAGKAGQSLRQAVEKMEKDAYSRLAEPGDRAEAFRVIDDFHEWRGLSFTLADRLLPSSIEDGATPLAKSMISCIRSLLLPEVAEEAVVADASVIIEGVAKLNLDLSKCRAKYRIDLGKPLIALDKPWDGKKNRNYGMRYDPTTMEEKRNVVGARDRGHENLFVDLIAAPGLVKSGSSEGVKDDKQLTLKKMEVLCNLISTVTAVKRDATAAETGGQGQQQGDAADTADREVEEDVTEMEVIVLDD